MIPSGHSRTFYFLTGISLHINFFSFEDVIISTGEHIFIAFTLSGITQKRAVIRPHTYSSTIPFTSSSQIAEKQNSR